jgi:guanine deaminase
MGLEDKIGNLNPGSEADFIELDLMANPILQQRLLRCKTLDQQLFAAITLGDERLIEKTYVNGNLVYQKGAKPCGHNSTSGLHSLSNGSMSSAR